MLGVIGTALKTAGLAYGTALLISTIMQCFIHIVATIMLLKYRGAIIAGLDDWIRDLTLKIGQSSLVNLDQKSQNRISHETEQAKSLANNRAIGGVGKAALAGATGALAAGALNPGSKLTGALAKKAGALGEATGNDKLSKMSAGLLGTSQEMKKAGIKSAAKAKEGVKNNLRFGADAARREQEGLYQQAQQQGLLRSGQKEFDPLNSATALWDQSLNGDLVRGTDGNALKDSTGNFMRDYSSGKQLLGNALEKWTAPKTQSDADALRQENPQDADLKKYDALNDAGMIKGNIAKLEQEKADLAAEPANTLEDQQAKDRLLGEKQSQIDDQYKAYGDKMREAGLDPDQGAGNDLATQNVVDASAKQAKAADAAAQSTQDQVASEGDLIKAQSDQQAQADITKNAADLVKNPEKAESVLADQQAKSAQADQILKQSQPLEEQAKGNYDQAISKATVSKPQSLDSDLVHQAVNGKQIMTGLNADNMQDVAHQIQTSDGKDLESIAGQVVPESVKNLSAGNLAKATQTMTPGQLDTLATAAKTSGVGGEQLEALQNAGANYHKLMGSASNVQDRLAAANGYHQAVDNVVSTLDTGAQSSLSQNVLKDAVSNTPAASNYHLAHLAAQSLTPTQFSSAVGSTFSKSQLDNTVQALGSSSVAGQAQQIQTETQAALKSATTPAAKAQVLSDYRSKVASAVGQLKDPIEVSDVAKGTARSSLTSYVDTAQDAMGKVAEHGQKVQQYQQALDQVQKTGTSLNGVRRVRSQAQVIKTAADQTSGLAQEVLKTGTIAPDKITKIVNANNAASNVVSKAQDAVSQAKQTHIQATGASNLASKMYQNSHKIVDQAVRTSVKTGGYSARDDVLANHMDTIRESMGSKVQKLDMQPGTVRNFTQRLHYKTISDSAEKGLMDKTLKVKGTADSTHGDLTLKEALEQAANRGSEGLKIKHKIGVQSFLNSDQ